MISPFAPHVELLDTIPGIDRRSAEAMVAEIGVDMARFGHPGRLASWVGECPGQHESAGKHKTGRTRKGSRWLQVHFHEAAKAARSKGTYLSAQNAGLRPRRGHTKAIVAVEHSILVAAYHILALGVRYSDRRTSSCVARIPNATHRLARHIEGLGFCVTIAPPEAA